MPLSHSTPSLSFKVIHHAVASRLVLHTGTCNPSAIPDATLARCDVLRCASEFSAQIFPHHHRSPPRVLFFVIPKSPKRKTPLLIPGTLGAPGRGPASGCRQRRAARWQGPEPPDAVRNTISREYVSARWGVLASAHVLRKVFRQQL